MNKKALILFFPLTESGGGRLLHKNQKFISNIPWALLSLERMIRHLDLEVILIDERLNRDYKNTIEKVKGRLLFAGVSSLAGLQIGGGVKFVETLRSIDDTVPVIWGGWFPTVFPEVLIRDGYSDYVCVGQGEIPFKTFTERMLAGEDVADIAGIAYKKNGEIIINPNEKLVNPTTFPKINLDLIDINGLIDLNGAVSHGYRGVDYLATYGCTNKCGFCSVVQVFGSKWFPGNVADIISDMKYFKEKAGISHVTFWDENLFASKKFVLEFCNEMIHSGLSLTWGAYAHIGYFLKNYSDEEIQLIYKAGCRDIRLGAESGDQQVLDAIHKNIKVKDTLSIVRLLRKYKITARIFLMACFPMDPDKDFWRSLNLMGKALLINPSLYIKMRFYVPLPKTDLMQISTEKGMVLPATTQGLMEYFLHSFTFSFKAPWAKKNYQGILDRYVKFYFLFLDLSFYRYFPAKYRSFIFLLTVFIYPAVYFRIKFNIMKFPFEAMILGKLLPYEDYHKLVVESYMVC
jgi:anaerobic magnesium-protoporphyrin IX monomethyl ester cyclase